MSSRSGLSLVQNVSEFVDSVVPYLKARLKADHHDEQVKRQRKELETRERQKDEFPALYEDAVFRQLEANKFDQELRVEVQATGHVQLAATDRLAETIRMSVTKPSAQQETRKYVDTLIQKKDLEIGEKLEKYAQTQNDLRDRVDRLEAEAKERDEKLETFVRERERIDNFTHSLSNLEDRLDRILDDLTSGVRREDLADIQAHMEEAQRSGQCQERKIESLHDRLEDNHRQHEQSSTSHRQDLEASKREFSNELKLLQQMQSAESKAQEQRSVDMRNYVDNFREMIENCIDRSETQQVQLAAHETRFSEGHFRLSATSDAEENTELRKAVSDNSIQANLSELSKRLGALEQDKSNFSSKRKLDSTELRLSNLRSGQSNINTAVGQQGENMARQTNALGVEMNRLRGELLALSRNHDQLASGHHFLNQHVSNFGAQNNIAVGNLQQETASIKAQIARTDGHITRLSEQAQGVAIDHSAKIDALLQRMNDNDNDQKKEKLQINNRNTSLLSDVTTLKRDAADLKRELAAMKKTGPPPPTPAGSTSLEPEDLAESDDDSEPIMDRFRRLHRGIKRRHSSDYDSGGEGARSTGKENREKHVGRMNVSRGASS